ncbi:Transcriptional regulator, TetR family [Acidisarcina polymorpha]|uniref:Transcriptional regulator, TetR family n=1 Tax=Acidisarcina polymorpha TaxID=2211140 RepID=A0A2Z5G5P3_9BACT|nr:TetR/AcrR family transcriptional regulator [Acidisarcina polymorpha]AXC13876.1 Transcriptional regulator, TetR family [Acidisarcina polymorpha]
MRYDLSHKEASRQRIVEAASQRFRLNGAEAVRIADVMQMTGMTVGGFYKHFESKDDLLETAVSAALETVSARITTQVAGLGRSEALRAVISFYLSEEHVKHPELGCALAALGTEVAHFPPRVRREVSKALDAYADRLAFLMPGDTPAAQRGAFLILFPSMAGCVMTARAHKGSSTRAEILAGARSFFISAFCSPATKGPSQ